jgi:D-alanyl-D-alanine carboxypeptidase
MIHKIRHDYIELVLMYVGAVITLLLLITVATPLTYKKIGIIAPQKVESQSPFIFNSNTFTGVTVTAKAFVVYDIVNGKVIAGKNETEILPLASITKIMTAVSALTHHEGNTKITISPANIDGAYDLGLKKNQIWSLSELLKYTLVFSSNDGAQAIADNLGGRSAFVRQMNIDATALNLPLTFTQPAGLDEGSKLGGEGSALSVAKLFVIAVKEFPAILDATTKTRGTFIASNGKISGIPNTNQEIENLFGAEASKTGFTDSAGGNLAVVVDIAVGHPVVIVVLGSTKEERFTDMKILYTTLRKSVI